MPVATSSPVLEFYNDAKVFITGGTGFVGKVLIEKLLRVCPNVQHIYLLIRAKKGKDPRMRLKELFDDALFKRLHAEKPGFEKKVTCIPGDVAALRLNMSDSDYEFLTKEITHVFHSAASVRFNEPLKGAININILGTREVVAFSNKCTRLKVLVHVSTAYSNCLQTDVVEEFYEPPMTPDTAINLAASFSEDRLNTLTRELIKPYPNTYTFSKAIGENIIKENAKYLPSLIVRPSIVTGTLKEPTTGYIDNVYGPTGAIIGVGLGLIRVNLMDVSCEANIVPVDLTVNAIISAAWEVGSTFNNNTIVEKSITESNGNVGLTTKKEISPKIYNFVSTRNNTPTWNDFVEKTRKVGCNFPSERAIWYYTLTTTRRKWLYLSLVVLLHYIPGLLFDAVLLLLGKKPQLIKAYHKIYVFTDATSFFSTHNWAFTYNNTTKLWSSLSDKDKELFHFDMSTFNWDKYLEAVVYGIRTFLLKEGDDKLPSARRKMFFFWIAHRLVQFSLVVFSLWIISKFLFVFDTFNTQFNDQILVQMANST